MAEEDAYRRDLTINRRGVRMASSAKTIIPDKCPSNGEWTVVLPRRANRKRQLPKVSILKEQLAWAPTDVVIDPARESKLMQKMTSCMKKIESSQFCQTFLAQMETPDASDHFLKVLGSESKMPMVIYGIGSIESYEPPRMQLGLAILMKRKFSWIGDIEVFDPIISVIEARVLESLGCSVMSVNEHGRRCALKPTLFYMPHCEAELYDNLIQANWRVDMLNRLVIFGNSFSTYEQYVSEFKNSAVVDSARHIVAVRGFTHEFEIDTVTDDYFGAFHDSSWHFINPVLEAELQPAKIDCFGGGVL